MGLVDVIKGIGGRLKGMFLGRTTIEKKMKVQTVISKKMEESIQLWGEMYMNHPPWEGEVEHGACMNLPSAVCSEFARLILTEFDFSLDGNDMSDFIKLQMKSLLRPDNIVKYVEAYSAYGGIVFKPYVKSVDGNGIPNRIGIDVLYANEFYPLAFDDDMVTSAIFVDSLKKQRYMYTRLEMHTWTPEKYTVVNKAFRSEEIYNFTDTETAGDNVRDRFREEIPLTDVEEWEGIQPEVEIANIETPLFVYIKVPVPNTSDPKSPLGASVFHRAEMDFREADKKYGGFVWEYEAKKAKIFADSTMFDEERDEEGNLNLTGIDQKLFRLLHSDTSLNEGTKNLIEPYSPDIRDTAWINGLNEDLRQIEFKCGLAYGTLSHTTEVEKTAEEIRMSKQRSYHSVDLMQQAWDGGLKELCKVLKTYCLLYGIVADADVEPVITWGDGVLQDTDKELQIRMQLANSGYLRKEYVTSYWFGCSPEQALEEYMPADVPDAEERFPFTGNS